MPTRRQNRPWRLFLIYFRRFRICTWSLVLIFLGALLYLNQIGLPDFVKKPLIERLHDRGIDLQFTRLRLHFYRGIVADNVLFGREADASSPKLSLKEVQVRIDYGALLKRQVQISSLLLRGGRLTWPVVESNQPPRELTADDIRTELRFLPGDLWELQPFQATFAGAHIELFVTVTNATVMRDWKLFPSAKASQGAGAAAHLSSAAHLQENLRQLADALGKIHFASPPELNLQISGDARDLTSFHAQLRVRAAGAETPWGTFNSGLLLAKIIPARPNEPPGAEVILRAAAARSRWAAASNLDLTFHALPGEGGTNFNADLKFTAAWATSEWGTASNVQFTAQWVHSPTNAVPLSGRGELRVGEIQTVWGAASDASLTGWLFSPADAAAKPDPSWDHWADLAPYALDIDCRAGMIHSPELDATNLLCAARWLAPRLQISRLSADLCDGALLARGQLNVDTREFSFFDSSDFDVKKISGLLTPMSRHWLSQFDWKKPPRLEAEGLLLLPAWTNHHAVWRTDIKPNVKLRGHISAGAGAFRGVPFDSANLHFNYTNMLWQLPDLVANRPEGRLELAHESNERTQDYYFRIHSTLDPNAVRPMLNEKQADALDLVGFSQPPVVDGEIWGRWQDLDRVGFKIQVSSTNFTIRGESGSAFQTGIEYTNRVLKFVEPRVQRGKERGSASSVTVDFAAQKVLLTNALSSLDPQVVARAINPVAGYWLEPYRFINPPAARVEGVIPFNIEKGADLHFDVNGGPFEWWKFNVRSIDGRIDWVDQKLALRNVRCEFYRGTAEGGAEFDFSPDHGNGLHFEVAVADADLHSLIYALNPQTNRLEGFLTGRLAITDGNTDDPRTWRGTGHARLRDGLIWEIPVIGAFSYLLDNISPGLGTSRATEGSAAFVITNGLVHSDDLEVRATMMRMKYGGDVDFNGNLNAHVEAEILRDTWIFGRVLSMALWPVSKVFEYKVTGTLASPKVEPILPVIPKLILMPLHPFDTMKDLLPKLPDVPKTNSPPDKGATSQVFKPRRPVQEISFAREAASES